MLSPCRIDAINMTETQRKLLGRYVAAHRRNGYTTGGPLRLALVLAGEKSATILNPSPVMFPQSPLTLHHCVMRMLDQFDLASREIKGVPGWVISPSPHWLDFLPTVKTGTEGYARRLGVVFGYPTDDIEHFVQTRGSLTTPQEYVARGTFDAIEIAYIALAFYRPKDTQTGYERAIARGKQNYACLHELAHDWDLPDLTAIADCILDEFAGIYSGKIQPVDESESQVQPCQT